MSSSKCLKKASDMTGDSVAFRLIKETGVLKYPASSDAEDVLGFNYIVYDNGTCYEYYAANPPLVGMTQPVPVSYPLGLAVFDTPKIDYKQAVKLFHSGNWGSKFTSILLCKPLHPDVKDPSWYFVSDLGAHVIINANTGDIKSIDVG
ncbi:MAG TPA: hypothetical protein VHT34_13565 [Clostridia bacterium]|nr:hypothetical protein [Clostridia bacterium]